MTFNQLLQPTQPRLEVSYDGFDAESASQDDGLAGGLTAR